MRPAAEPLARDALLVGLPPTLVLKAGDYRESPVIEGLALRQEVHALVDTFSDDQLPMVNSFLEGLRPGLDHPDRQFLR